MLKEFTVKNFKSYNNEVTFTMEADANRVSEYSNHIVHICDNNILKVGSIYGPNGGGKSNILDVLRILPSALQTGMIFGQSTELNCVFSDSSEIEISIFFIVESYEIGYRFKFTTHSEERKLWHGEPAFLFVSQVIEFIEENVIYREKGTNEFIELLCRDKTGLVESKLLENEQIKLPRISESMSAVRKIYDDYANNKYNDSKNLQIINILMKQVNSISQLDFTDSSNNMTTETINHISKNKKELITLLNELDIKIKDIKLIKKEDVDVNSNKEKIYFVRSVSQNKKEKLIDLPFSNESKGTKKIFWILLSLLESCSKGVIYYADDLNAYLHPKLSKAIVEFMNSDKCKSQLIFNSHDIINMSNELFRRDEIWFAYRDENYSSVLIPLSNIVNYKGKQVRNDAIYSKQYLEGKYGADPFIVKGLHWND